VRATAPQQCPPGAPPETRPGFGSAGCNNAAGSAARYTGREWLRKKRTNSAEASGPRWSV